ncbi:MAG: hypothetical protein M1821_009330 [Bathelium mastoideum]|nr:MAG: hypothetical protein M1821_009330 [Bathelium mastoideum]
MKFTTILALSAIAAGVSAHSNGITNPTNGCILDTNCGAPFCGCQNGGDKKRWLGGGVTNIPRRFVEYLNGPKDVDEAATAAKH